MLRGWCVMVGLAVVGCAGTEVMGDAWDGPLVVASPVTLTAEGPMKVAFGNPVTLKVTLRNGSADPVRWPAGRVTVNVFVEMDDREGYRRRFGDDDENWTTAVPAKRSGSDAEPEEIVLKPGEEAAFEVSTPMMTSDLQKVTLHFSLRPTGQLRDGETARDVWKSMPDAEGQGEMVVAPSELMQKMWRASTAEEKLEVQKLLNARLRESRMKEQAWERSRSTGQWFWQKSAPTNELALEWGYEGWYAEPFLLSAAKDADPLVRAEAVGQLGVLSTNESAFDGMLTHEKGRVRPPWTEGLTKTPRDQDSDQLRKAAAAALKDADAGVRQAAVSSLQSLSVDEDKEAVVALKNDPDAGVRAAVAEYLETQMEDVPGGMQALLELAGDVDQKVAVVAALGLQRHADAASGKELAAVSAKQRGEAAFQLLRLVSPKEDENLADWLRPGFEGRSVEARRTVMAMIAGHRDAAARELIWAGLCDADVEVRRQALLRAMAMPDGDAAMLLQGYAARGDGPLMALAAAARTEVATRQLFPFPRDRDAGVAAPIAGVTGIRPRVSPDEKYIAYLDGSEQPGRRFRSPRETVKTHVMTAAGTDDRVVSRLRLTGWLTDSSAVESALGPFAAVSDLRGNVIGEFGQTMGGTPGLDVGAVDGHEMVLTKMLPSDDAMESGTVMSPDGRWLASIVGGNEWQRMDRAGDIVPLEVPFDFGVPAMLWSPDGRWVSMPSLNSMTIVDVAAGKIAATWSVNRKQEWWAGSMESENNPWTADGKRVAYVDRGQVWTRAPDGSAPVQLTFDVLGKGRAAMSRDGRRVAYVAAGPDQRLDQDRTSLWVVDVDTKLAVRVTKSEEGLICGVDWLGDEELVFDRLDNRGKAMPAVLYRVTLK